MSRKILLIGSGRHGKDTVAQFIAETTGLNFESSSLSAAKIFIFDELKEKFGYKTFEECYTDRHNHRALWHDMICKYNTPNKSKLAEDILHINDMYVGMRSNEELLECKRKGLFDTVIGVFDPDKPIESKESFNIDIFKHSDYIIITGDLNRTKKNVEKFCKILM